jgi:hypothetical protein
MKERVYALLQIRLITYIAKGIMPAKKSVNGFIARCLKPRKI